jgi:hypothetical protein
MADDSGVILEVRCAGLAPAGRPTGDSQGMSHLDSTAAQSSGQPDASAQVSPETAELDEELSRFAHRLAGFGLGEALDALLARRDVEEPVIRPNPDPEPC